jgi:peptide-methionine (R)-S-oxide reductase
MITRRMLLTGTAMGAVLLATRSLWGKGGPQAEEASFPVSYSDDEWRQRLTPAQYAVLRQSGTERPFTSPLLHEARAGVFGCVACDLDLFQSNTKFDSHTGWPSFWAPIKDAVQTKQDLSLGMIRTEVHCSHCGGHNGHVFPDGPPPTGMRYCMDGVAMTFKPAA